MKYLFAFIALSFFCFSSFAQEIIEEAGIKLELPGEEWSLNEKVDQPGIIAYIYKREAIENKDGVKVIPNIAIIIEDVDSTTDVIMYSLYKRMNVPFEVEAVYTHEDSIIVYKNAILFKASYEDELGLHQIYVMHAINYELRKGIQVVFDVTKELFENIKEEFLFTLKSIDETGQNNFIKKELDRWGIEITGEGETTEIILPEDMDGPNWGLKCMACEDAGYNLKQHTGETVKLTRFYTAETIGEEDPVDVWVIHDGTEVFCIYKAVGGNSTLAPGIMSVKK